MLNTIIMCLPWIDNYWFYIYNARNLFNFKFTRSSFMNRKVAAFLGRHNFSIHQDINSVVEAMLFDMNEGLSGRPSGEDMIRTYANPPSQATAGKSVI